MTQEDRKTIFEGKNGIIKSNNNKSNRLTYVDVVSGIMICRMITSHCCQKSSYYNDSLEIILELLVFFMPWFFYKSGTFFSPKDSTKLLKKDTNKFIRCFIVYSFLGWIVWCIGELIGNYCNLLNCIIIPIKTLIVKGYIVGNPPLWFLLSLFFVRQIANYLFKGNNLYVLIMSFISFCFAYLLNIIGWHNYSFWFGNFFSGLFFFLMGYLFKNIEQKSIVFLISTFVFGIVVFAKFLGLLEFPFLYMGGNQMISGNYILFYPTALGGIILTNNIFRLLCIRYKFGILEYIGRNSLYFYVMHWIIITIFVFLIRHFFHIESSLLFFIILLGACVLFLPLFSNLIFFVKKKSVFLNRCL